MVKFTATLRGDTLEWSVARNCPQRGILLTHSSEACLHKSYRDPGMAVIHWGMSYSPRKKIPKKVSPFLQEALNMEH